jgi:cytochrome c peroxidase
MMNSPIHYLLAGWLALLALTGFASNATAQETDTTADAPENDTRMNSNWSDAEIGILRSLSLRSLKPLQADPSNAVADDSRAAALGQKLFFDTRLSANGKVSCASCHQPDNYFTDGLGQAQGIATTPRGAPTLLGASYNAWYFWDGRRDSQWAQALGPLESGLEHGGTRMEYARLIIADSEYHAEYEAVFGALPDLSDPSRFPKRAGPSSDRKIIDAWRTMSEDDQQLVTRVFVNIGKALAAYQRLLMPGPARFDTYVKALQAGDKPAMAEAMTNDEVTGFKLFIGKAMCIRCHNGPLFTDYGFHNIGVPVAEGLHLDPGRYQGVQKALKDEFNCLSDYSDAGQTDCVELRFAKTMREETIGAFKAPTLRNVAETAPYMHSGQFADLDAVLDHYNKATTSRKAPIGHSDLLPINLTPEELAQLKAFLHTLSGPPAVAPELLKVPGKSNSGTVVSTRR